MMTNLLITNSDDNLLITNPDECCHHFFSWNRPKPSYRHLTIIFKLIEANTRKPSYFNCANCIKIKDIYPYVYSITSGKSLSLLCIFYVT